MAAGTGPALAALTGAVMLSQFFRSCLAVIAPELQHDLGLNAAGFGALSSAFFGTFALMQLPCGVAFDRYGVGRPTAVLTAVGIAGGALFALAPNGGTALVAQAALGVACAPAFMGLLHYASEHLDESRFHRVTAVTNGLGILGALVAAAPLGWAAAAFGWRAPILCATAGLAVVCIAVARTLHDRGHAEARAESPAAVLRSCAGLLRIRPFWTLIPLCMALAAGTSFRSAWGGPYFASVFGLETVQRGIAISLVTLTAFGAAFVLPVLMRRWSLKTTVQRWSGASLLLCLALAAAPGLWLPLDLVLLAAMCTVGMLHPMVMSHGREMIGPALRGRGLGLLNSFVFLGSAVVSAAYGWIAEAGQRRGWSAAATFGWIFVAAALWLLMGLVAYRRSPVARGRPTPEDDAAGI